MFHSMPLITTLATALGLALLLGFLVSCFKLPLIVGYLLAGILIGPFTPGFVANVSIARELAEIGIMLLMFGVGLHFSLNDLLAVRRVALPGAMLQILVATMLGTGVALMWGWNIGGALVFGLALSVASTVVLLRGLESAGILESINGRIAVGWLVVEDLVMIIVLVLLPALSEGLGGKISHEMTENLWKTLIITVTKISVFIVLMMMLGRRLFPKILWKIAHTGSRELFTLCIIATAISIAYISAKLFGISFALGAFFSGMMMRESEFSHRAAEESLPLREAFAVLFFVSIGMLFDPTVLINHPLQVLVVVSIIVFGKTIAAAILVLAFRYPLNTALTVSASLAQIGEFSFILAGLGVSLGLLPTTGQSLILAGALISITINPLLFKIIKPLQTWICSQLVFTKLLTSLVDPLTELPMTTDHMYLSGQIVLVGYGRVGGRIGEILIKNNIPCVVVEQNREIVSYLRERQITAVSGNASESTVLIQAHIAHASMLVIATPDIFEIRQMINIAHILNPKIEILIRIHSEEEAILMQKIVNKVFLSELELSKNMSKYILKRYGKHQ